MLVNQDLAHYRIFQPSQRNMCEIIVPPRCQGGKMKHLDCILFLALLAPLALAQQHSATVTITIAPTPDWSVSAVPPAQTVKAGGLVNYTVSVTAQGGWTGTIKLSAANLPSGTTAVFSPATITVSGSLPATATLTIQTAPTAPVVTDWPIRIEGTATANPTSNP